MASAPRVKLHIEARSVHETEPDAVAFQCAMHAARSQTARRLHSFVLQKLDLQLEGLAAFQEGAMSLKANVPLCLEQQEGGRLACVTQGGVAVGLVPADKRGMLSRGPWSGTVRSVVKRRVAAPMPAAGGEGAGAPPERAPQQLAGSSEQPAEQLEPSTSNDQQQEQGEQQQQGAALPPQLVVQQVLVRFTPEEQRWQQRQVAPEQREEDEDGGERLSQEQLEELAASEEVRWMLRDERLQKVVAEIDAAPDRERALVRALQAPYFKEFADKVLSTVSPEGPSV